MKHAELERTLTELCRAFEELYGVCNMQASVRMDCGMVLPSLYFNGITASGVRIGARDSLSAKTEEEIATDFPRAVHECSKQIASMARL